MIFLCMAWNCVCVCPCIHQITSPLCAALCSSPFPPSTFRLCSEGRSAVTQGCHMQKKLPSNNIEGCEATVCSPPPHLMCPLPPSLSLFLCCRDGVAWGCSGGSSASCSDEFRQQDTEQTERRREGGERVREEEGGGWGRGGIRRCSVCLLPASCYSALPLCRRNRPFPPKQLLSHSA